MAVLLRLLELFVIIAVTAVRHNSCYKLPDDSSLATATENGSSNDIRIAETGSGNWRERFGKLLAALNQEREDEEEERRLIDSKLSSDHLYNTISSPEYLLDSDSAGDSSINPEQLNNVKRFSEFLGGKRKRSSNLIENNKRFSEFLGGKRKRYSEFLGGRKRSTNVDAVPRMSQVLHDDRLKRFSEFLGGKRSVQLSSYGGRVGVPVSYGQSGMFDAARL